jgi:hypothetical protein
MPVFTKQDITDIGMWRSWLARTAGGREAAGSSPVIPTKSEII